MNFKYDVIVVLEVAAAANMAREFTMIMNKVWTDELTVLPKDCCEIDSFGGYSVACTVHLPSGIARVFYSSRLLYGTGMCSFFNDLFNFFCVNVKIKDAQFGL